MGLDIVEMIMAVEEEFELAIPNEIASTLETPGLVHEYVVTQLKENKKIKSNGEQDQEIWEKIQEVIVSQLGVTIDEVTKDAKFVDDLKAD
ncbi:MAG: hypothetical protein PVG66_10465 [Chromatiales bacterium]|jgi:acyl carrier protein